MKSTLLVLASIIIVLLSILLIISKSPRKPNNQYELFIYQDHIDLNDGDRKVVENISWDSVGELKEIIEKDNQ